MGPIYNQADAAIKAMKKHCGLEPDALKKMLSKMLSPTVSSDISIAGKGTYYSLTFYLDGSVWLQNEDNVGMGMDGLDFFELLEKYFNANLQCFDQDGPPC